MLTDARPAPIVCMLIGLAVAASGAWDLIEARSWSDADIERNVEMNYELHRLNVLMESRGKEEVADPAAARAEIEAELRQELADERDQASRRMIAGAAIFSICALLLVAVWRHAANQAASRAANQAALRNKT